MNFPVYYEFFCGARIIAGHDGLERIPLLLEELGVANPIILTDKGVVGAGLLAIVLASLRSEMRDVTVFDDIPPDSDILVVNRIAREYKKNACDSIIAVGGGSVIDTAKGVNALVSEDESDLFNLKGAGRIKRQLKPFIAMPTTSGTGSEATLVAVVKDNEKKVKCIFTSVFLQPNIAILDSRMTLTLPPAVTAATGMDALTHAMEAYYCLQKNPISDSHALLAVELISQNLLKIMENPHDKEGRLNLAIASNLAGIAFANSMVGMVHTLGHSFGAVCGVPHGVCMAVLLPYGLEYNMHKKSKEIGQLLLPLVGVEEYQKTPFRLRGERVVSIIREMNSSLNKITEGKHPLRFKDILGRDGRQLIREEDLATVAKVARNDGSIFMNPEELNYEDLLMVATASFAGNPLDVKQIKKG
ncbi:MAG: iron-containing alcohol dehydrogenase [Deltaproteobacteria bacterium]|nr:iron-containing alcohol dehydrogenase [Deltaproteobacteria bacterium]